VRVDHRPGVVGCARWAGQKWDDGQHGGEDEADGDHRAIAYRGNAAPCVSGVGYGLAVGVASCEFRDGRAAWDIVYRLDADAVMILEVFTRSQRRKRLDPIDDILMLDDLVATQMWQANEPKSCRNNKRTAEPRAVTGRDASLEFAEYFRARNEYGELLELPKTSTNRGLTRVNICSWIERLRFDRGSTEAVGARREQAVRRRRSCWRSRAVSAAAKRRRLDLKLATGALPIGYCKVIINDSFYVT
jgi:hypothetical protein